MHSVVARVAGRRAAFRQRPRRGFGGPRRISPDAVKTSPQGPARMYQKPQSSSSLLCLWCGACQLQQRLVLVSRAARPRLLGVQLASFVLSYGARAELRAWVLEVSLENGVQARSGLKGTQWRACATAP